MPFALYTIVLVVACVQDGMALIYQLLLSSIAIHVNHARYDLRYQSNDHGTCMWRVWFPAFVFLGYCIRTWSMWGVWWLREKKIKDYWSKINTVEFWSVSMFFLTTNMCPIICLLLLHILVTRDCCFKILVCTIVLTLGCKIAIRGWLANLILHSCSW